MNKRFIRVAVFCALTATAAPVFVGCSDDYDADIAGLQDQINKINGVVGITGDDMAAAIDEVVKQLQTKIDSLGGIVGDKVNVDELTASVNNLNQLIDQKAYLYIRVEGLHAGLPTRNQQHQCRLDQTDQSSDHTQRHLRFARIG